MDRRHFSVHGHAAAIEKILALLGDDTMAKPSSLSGEFPLETRVHSAFIDSKGEGGVGAWMPQRSSSSECPVGEPNVATDVAP